MLNPEEQKSHFLKFVEGNSILILDQNPSARNYVFTLLKLLKVKESSIFQCAAYAEGQKIIDQEKPKLIICDYLLDQKSCLDLTPRQRKHYKNPNECLFVLTTANTAQITVAKAAEEEIDAYILKPFSGDILRDTIVKIVAEKREPSEYQKMIIAGKTTFETGQVDEAEKNFTNALTLHPAPALAYYYLGKLAQTKKAYEIAEQKFLTGLNFNRIHYKCLLGLYEVLIQQKKLADAYAVVKRTSSYYPANSQRLTDVLRLAILTQNYDDIEGYYRAFTAVKERNEELIKYVGAALVVCGKFYLKKTQKIRALDVFRHAVAADPTSLKVLKEVISSLLEFNLAMDADEILRSFYGAKTDHLDFHSLSYLIEDKRKTRSDLILIGQDLLLKGFHDPVIYEILARRLVEAGLNPPPEKFSTPRKVNGPI